MTARPTLLLHIGHEKTGSSFLQSALAGSAPTLAQHGVTYPVEERHRKAALGMISTGNGQPLVRALDQLRPAALPAPQPGAAAVLLSSEMAFKPLARQGGVARLSQAAEEAGYGAIRIFFFLRDPVAHCASSFQQWVKRGGYTGTIDSMATRFNFPERVATLLAECDAHPGVEVTVRNYGAARKDVLGVLADWLGVDRSAITAPPIAVVNRSLTLGELTFQRALNEELGKSGSLMADAFCERLPEVAAEHLLPSLAAQEAMWQRLSPAIERVNARLGPEHGYRRDVAEQAAAPRDDYRLSDAQLTLMARTLGAEIRRLQAAAAPATAPSVPRPSVPRKERLKTLLETARRQANTGAVAEAETSFREALGLAPKHAQARIGLTQLLLRAGRTEEARQVSERASG